MLRRTSKMQEELGKSQEPYDFTHTWYIKLKTTNKQIIQIAKQRKTHRPREQYVVTREEGEC